MAEKNAGVSQALEDYLEAIYILQKVHNAVRVAEIATYLDVTMPSVTGSMRKLAEKKLIKYVKRRYVQLTDEGERLARAVHRKHEELYHFFHNVLNVESRTAEEDACRAEHVLHRETVEKLIRFAQWAETSAGEGGAAATPGGPAARAGSAGSAVSADGGGRESRTLSGAAPGERVKITKLKARGELRKRLSEMGLTRGAEVRIVRVAPLGDPVDVLIRGYHLSLRKEEAAKIEVEA
ncbi:MAG: metal-dependent transcriptional regulator [bacterium]